MSNLKSFLNYLKTHMVDGAGTEFGIQLLAGQLLQIVNDEGPEMNHIVTRDPVTFFDD